LVTDVEIVVGLGVVLIIVYLAGSYWKHKKLTQYAHWFEDRFGKRAKVKFRGYGHAGLKIKCEMNDKSDGFRELYFALSLGARENLMYYPLAPLFKDHDKINCWGVVDRPIRSNLKLVRADDKKQVEHAESMANATKLNNGKLADLGYVAYATNSDYANRFLSQAGVASRLKEFNEVSLIELDITSSLIRIVARLREQQLPDFCGFVLSLGRAA
jgi:hypothetical protein